jgi:hypothetical protein
MMTHQDGPSGGWCDNKMMPVDAKATSEIVIDQISSRLAVDDDG